MDLNCALFGPLYLREHRIGCFCPLEGFFLVYEGVVGWMPIGVDNIQHLLDGQRIV